MKKGRLINFVEEPEIVNLLDQIAVVKGASRSTILRGLVRDFIKNEIERIKEGKSG